MTSRRDALLRLIGLPALALPVFSLASCTPDGSDPRRVATGDEEGGIGGTGVFGTVTALGSVLVNGLRLETWAGTAVESLAVRGAAVLPGDVVAAEVVRDADRLLATRLAVFHPLIGPLAATPDGGLAVLGTRLLLSAGVPVRGEGGEETNIAVLRPGMTVAASGLWRGDAVVASAIRVLRQGPAPQAVLRGQLRRTMGGLMVGDTRLSENGPQAGIAADSFVTVQGVPDGAAALRVEHIEARLLGVFAGRVVALSVEGFLAPNRIDPGFHLAGFGLPLDPASRFVPRVGERQLFLGRYQNGFRVDAGFGLPVDPVARGAVLAEPEAGVAIRRWLGRG